MPGAEPGRWASNWKGRTVGFGRQCLAQIVAAQVGMLGTLSHMKELILGDAPLLKCRPKGILENEDLWRTFGRYFRNFSFLMKLGQRLIYLALRMACNWFTEE